MAFYRCLTDVALLLLCSSAIASQARIQGPGQIDPVLRLAQIEQQQQRLKEIEAANLHPIVQSMAINASNDTAECALALLSLDRKLRLPVTDQSQAQRQRRAGQQAAAICGASYTPCVDARISRKLLDHANRRTRASADSEVRRFCNG